MKSNPQISRCYRKNGFRYKFHSDHKILHFRLTNTTEVSGSQNRQFA